MATGTATPRTANPKHSMATLLIGLLLLGNVVQAARIYDLFWEDASRFGYIAQGLPILIYMCVAIYRRHWISSIVSFLILAVIANSHTVFVELSGSQENYNSIATFIAMMTLAPFVETRIDIEKILKILLTISCIYLVSYVILNPIIHTYYTTNLTSLLQGHGDNERRIYLAAAYAAFVMLYGLRANTSSIFLRAALILLGAVSLWLSDTRTMILIVLLVFALGALNLLIRPIRVAIFAVVAFGISLLMLGFIFTDWNPYSAMIADSSGAYRAIEYSWVVRVLEHNWIMGVGTPGKFVDLQLYLQRDFSVPRSIWIFATDLGPLGAYFQFGLIGLVAFIAAVTFCMISPWKNTSAESQAMQMTAFACAIYGVSSPLLLMEPSSIFLMLMVAAWWRDRRNVASGAVPRPRSRAQTV